MAKTLLALIAGFILFSGQASAQKITADQREYIRANTIFMIYHELGHALIDLLRLPVFGREEDAADVLGVVLSEKINSEKEHQFILLAAADNFAKMAKSAERDGDEPALWDTHGLDLQRYYTLVCLYYGADPKGRRQVAKDRRLPEGRRETCAEEFRLAEESWGPVLEDIAVSGQERGWIRFRREDRPRNDGERVVLATAKAEAAALNARFRADKPLDMVFGQCGEANAYYDEDEQRVIICAELAELFTGVAPLAGQPDHTQNKQ